MTIRQFLYQQSLLWSEVDMDERLINQEILTRDEFERMFTMYNSQDKEMQELGRTLLQEAFAEERRRWVVTYNEKFVDNEIRVR